MLPEKLTLKDLERSHPVRTAYLDTFVTISDLREGYTALKRKVTKYLPIRPGEDQDIYRLRIKKFTYTPVMTTAIREFVAKLVSSSLHISGATGSFWGEFRTSLDGAGQDELDLLTEVFTTLLYYGKCYLAVDSTVPATLPRSLAEDTQVKPFLRVYSPLDVLNEGKDWYLTRTVTYNNSPTEDATAISRWTYFTPEEIAVYETEVQLGYGEVGETLVARAKSGGRWYQVATRSATVEKHPDSVVHNLGECPMVCLELPSELWVAHTVMSKQLQYIRIESSWDNAGDIAGTVQRVFTPTPPSPVDDPSKLYVEPDYSQLQSSNAHILIGNKFAFVESTGGAITNLTSQLETIKTQINDLVSMGYKTSSDSGRANNQSGVSKQTDMTLLEDSMRSFGKKVANLYERALKLVSRWAGLNEDISVQGLDTYSVNSLEEVVTTTVSLQPLLPQLPPTVAKLWFAKLSSLMTGTVSQEDQAKIEEELEEIFAGELDPNNPNDIQQIMDTFGVDEDQARQMLTAP